MLLLFSTKSVPKKMVGELRKYTTDDVVKTYKRVFDNNSAALRKKFFEEALI